MAARGSRQHALCLLSQLLLAALFFPRVCKQQVLMPVLPSLTITPKDLALKTISQVVHNVQLQCQTPTNREDKVFGIIRLTLERHLEDTRPNINNPQIIAEASTENSVTGETQLIAQGGKANWSVTGEVTLTSTEGLAGVTIKRSGCWDAGSYTCKMQYYSDSGFNVRADAESNDYLSVHPSDIRVNVTPMFGSVRLFIGTQVNITCSGNVGSIRHNMYTLEWGWEYRDTASMTKQWKEYDGKASDFIIPMPPQKEACFERWFITLLLVLKERDSTRDYRCFLQRKESEMKVDAFYDSAQVITIPNFLGKSRTSLGKLGLVGIVFGVVALMCAAGFGLFFYRRRKLRVQKREEEITRRRQDIGERRKSMAFIAEKRKSLAATDKNSEGPTAPSGTSTEGKPAAKPTGTSGATKPAIAPEPSTALDDSSYVEESSVADTSTAVNEPSTERSS